MHSLLCVASHGVAHTKPFQLSSFCCLSGLKVCGIDILLIISGLVLTHPWSCYLCSTHLKRQCERLHFNRLICWLMITLLAQFLCVSCVILALEKIAACDSIFLFGKSMTQGWSGARTWRRSCDEGYTDRLTSRQCSRRDEWADAETVGSRAGCLCQSLQVTCKMYGDHLTLAWTSARSQIVCTVLTQGTMSVIIVTVW